VPVTTPPLGRLGSDRHGNASRRQASGSTGAVIRAPLIVFTRLPRTLTLSLTRVTRELAKADVNDLRLTQALPAGSENAVVAEIASGAGGVGPVRGAGVGMGVGATSGDGG
jgi:hypothetical protein